MVLKNSKKQVVTFLAIFCCWPGQSAFDVSRLIQSVQSSLPHSIKRVLSSRSAKAVGVTLATYGSYRLVQQYLRSRAISRLYEQVQPEQKLEHANGVVTLFAHGLGGTNNCGHAYKGGEIFSEDQLVSFDFQDSCEVRPTCPSCLAQDADIAKLKEYYDGSVKGWKRIGTDNNVKLYGLSRGAATVLNFLAIHKPSNVACAVLESPFDDLETIVQGKLKAFGIGHIPIVGSMLSACITPILTALPVGLQNHTVFGVYPKDVVSNIPKDIPLLFISSKQDRLIPQQSTQNLVDILKKSGHKNVHNIVCNTGDHCKTVLHESNGQVREKVKEFMANAQAFLEAQQSDTTVI